MIDIPENELLLFWHGVNISGIQKETVQFATKEYYQLNYPLFAGQGLSLECNANINNRIITQIECKEKIQLEELKNNPCCAFLSIAKKPANWEKNRCGYSFRISAHVDKDIAFLKRMMTKTFLISSEQVERIFNATGTVQDKYNYSTHPISGMGFCAKNAKQAYVQIYITNNTDTSTGEINRLGVEEEINNTYLLLNCFSFNYSKSKIINLMKHMYSQGMFAAFYGLDISNFGIEKFKIYFRTTYSLNYNIFCCTLNKLFAQYGKCADLPRWGDVQKAINSRTYNYIDCVAVALKKCNDELDVDGVQFYLAP